MMNAWFQYLVFLTALLNISISSERTPQEAAPLARELLNRSKLGHLATIMSRTGPLPDIDGGFIYH